MIVNVTLWYFFRLLELSVDTEFNLGSKPTLVKAFQFVTGTSIACQLITTPKISLLTAYISIHDFDITCVSETCLTSTTTMGI